MKDQIEEQCAKVLETYKDIEDMVPMMQLPDFEGRDCFWYFQRFSLFNILDVKIMDKYILRQWDGRADVNCSMLHYSAAYCIINNTNNTFITENLLKNLKQ